MQALSCCHIHLFFSCWIRTCLLTEALLVCLHHMCLLTEALPACLQLGFYGFNPGTMGQIIASDGTDFAIVSNNRLLCMPVGGVPSG